MSLPKIFPVLETKRFLLRNIRRSDAEEIYNYFSKEKVTKYYDLETFTEISESYHLIEN